MMNSAQLFNTQGFENLAITIRMVNSEGNNSNMATLINPTALYGLRDNAVFVRQQLQGKNDLVSVSVCRY